MKTPSKTTSIANTALKTEEARQETVYLYNPQPLTTPLPGVKKVLAGQDVRQFEQDNMAQVRYLSSV